MERPPALFQIIALECVFDVRPLKDVKSQQLIDGSLVCVPLYRGSQQITRHYCAFWLADRSGYYIEEFAGMLKAEFEKKPTPVSE